MSTTSPNKQYTVPTVGGDNYNWGTELNVTLGLLDQNLGGSLSVSVAGGANVPLTAAQAANLRLTFTGALTASIDVLLPANLGGVWQITNSTTGDYSLTLITAAAGSTGVTIPQGESQIVLSDGTNVVIGQTLAPTTVAAVTTGNPVAMPSQAVVPVSNTSGAPITLKWSASPYDGESHTVVDQGGNSGTYPIYVETSAGSVIDILNSNGASLTFTYSAALSAFIVD